MSSVIRPTREGGNYNVLKLNAMPSRSLTSERDVCDGVRVYSGGRHGKRQIPTQKHLVHSFCSFDIPVHAFQCCSGQTIWYDSCECLVQGGMADQACFTSSVCCKDAISRMHCGPAMHRVSPKYGSNTTCTRSQ